MVTKDEWQEWLAKKQELLEKIAFNANTQRIFIQRREMRGLRRVIRERKALLDELTAVSRQLQEADADGQYRRQFQSLVAAVAARQSEVLADSARVIAEARAEREKIAADLRKSRMGRSLQKHYVRSWELVQIKSGRRINKKG